MKIFITGACGYQGTKFVPILLSKGYKVVSLDTEWFGNRLPKHKNLVHLKKNLLDINKQDLKDVDLIVHLSSIANDPMGDLKQHKTWEFSCLATMKLLELAIYKKIKKIIYASSASVYGIKKEKLVTECLKLEPISTYNKAKMITERILVSYSDKINITIIRPATVCGLSERMRFDLSVNMLTYQAIVNKKITVFGGNQIRPNIHIDDLLDVYQFFFSNNKNLNGIFNAGFENISILQIAKMVSKFIDCKIKVFKNSNDPRSYRVDSSKLLKLGYEPKKNVEIAIQEIIKKYKNEKKFDPRSFSVNWLKEKHKKF